MPLVAGSTSSTLLISDDHDLKARRKHQADPNHGLLPHRTHLRHHFVRFIAIACPKTWRIRRFVNVGRRYPRRTFPVLV
jgi:hypothetical protein